MSNKGEKLAEFIKNNHNFNAYSEEGSENKKKFKRLSLSYLKEISDNFQQHGFEEEHRYFNAGGIAVSGDAILMMWNESLQRGFYISIGLDFYNGVLIRHTFKKNDFSGGTNRYLSEDQFAHMLNIETFVLV